MLTRQDALRLISGQRAGVISRSGGLLRHVGNGQARREVATVVVEFLYGSLAASQCRVGKPLKLGLEGFRSARRGDYRVIYRIDGQRRLIR